MIGFLEKGKQGQFLKIYRPSLPRVSIIFQGPKIQISVEPSHFLTTES